MSATSLKRRVQCYPPPKYERLIRAYAEYAKTSDSNAVSRAVKCFIDTLPADVRRAVDSIAKTTSKNSY